MKKTLIISILTFMVFGMYAQNSKVNTVDFIKTIKKISENLPESWKVTSDTAYPDEIIIYSKSIELIGNQTSNDPPYLKGECQIFFKMQSRISPDSIGLIRTRNKDLLEHYLTPINSKDNIKAWYEENRNALSLIDSEPTNYDASYSYRLKVYRMPKKESDVKDFNKIIDNLNQVFPKYNASF